MGVGGIHSYAQSYRSEILLDCDKISEYQVKLFGEVYLLHSATLIRSWRMQICIVCYFRTAHGWNTVPTHRSTVLIK